MPRSVSVLILAAGASTRMKGEIKQLLPWGKHTLLEDAINQAKIVSKNVYVVLGAYAKEILETTNLNVEVIQNNNWQMGMGNSISCGLKHIVGIENPEGILIMLADQPLIDATYLREMLKTFEEGESKIVATAHQSGPGVPAIFDNSILPELLTLQGDIGARKIIKKHLLQTKLISPNGKEVDVDTNENYLQIIDIQNIKYD